MDAIASLIYIFLAVVTIFSLFRYNLRRRVSRKAFRQLKKAENVVRQLTTAEREALIPVLHLAGPTKPLELISEQVYQLEGDFRHHGLASQRSGTTTHDTIGDVEVCFPYDATVFLQNSNRAEVVLTKKLAVVVSLNQGFDLVSSKQRAEHVNRQQPWQREDEHRPHTDDAAETLAGDKVILHGQRQETSDEVAMRATPGVGFWASLMLLGGVIATLVAGSRPESANVQLSSIIVAAVLLIVAAWLFWHRQSLPEPVLINCACGYINNISLPNPYNSETNKADYFLGTQLPLTIPSHWQPLLEQLPDEPTEVEVRSSDNELLSLGNVLNLAEEERLFPTLFWGRHFTVSLFALIGLIMLLAQIPDLFLDLRLCERFFGEDKVIRLDDRQVDQASSLQKGDVVSLNSSVRCQLPEYTPGYSLSPLDCRLLRWGGKAPQFADLQMSEVQQRFLAEEAVTTKVDTNFPNHRSSLAEIETDRITRQPFRERVVRMLSFDQLIRDINDLCRQAKDEGVRDIEQNCHSLQNKMASQVALLNRSQPATWQELVSLANGAGVTEVKEAMTYESVSYSLANLGERVAEAMLFEQALDKLAAARPTEEGGVLLELSYRARERFNIYDHNKRLRAQWRVYQSLVRPESYDQIDIEGLISEKKLNSAGIPVLTIDETFDSMMVIAAVVHMVLLVILVALLIIHGLLLVINYRKSSVRSRRLADYNQKRIIRL
jgi:hypothetical protein